MAETLEIENILTEEQLANAIAEKWQLWDTLRQQRVAQWKEIQEYLFATDTTHTTNQHLPWSNKTTIPKLCQIRDNLHTNYLATMFPKRKFFVWEGYSEADDTRIKKDTLENFCVDMVERSGFKDTVSRLILDYLDYGMAFAMPSWVDNSTEVDELREQVGYVGAIAKRISPLDIVFDPTATSFERSPKIIRSIVSMGDVYNLMMSNSNTPEEQEEAEETYRYLVDIRANIYGTTDNYEARNSLYDIAGFSNFTDYLLSGYAEVLTFYGDMFDVETGDFYKNHVIMVVDRHKVIVKKPNPSIFGVPPIYCVGWRQRPDNLWAMGPFENLVGMQYRLDHLENMKADVFDLIAYPPLKITGEVQDFEWGPMEHIYVDQGSNVELLSPNVQALQANTEIAILEQKMEEISGSPREAVGIRSPGEKTKFELQQLENGWSRIFQNKIAQFEEQMTERLLNAMIELSRRKMTSQTIRVFHDDLKIVEFENLTANDLTGQGRIRPLASRHFGEKAQLLQNLNGFFNSAIGRDQLITQHFSTIKIAKMVEELLGIEQYEVVQEYVRLSEQADSARQANVHEESVAMEAATPAGIREGDFDEELG
jgi:hypothetical protein